MKIAGNCIRNPEKIALKLVICRPAVGRRRLGRRLVSFIDTTAMQDRVTGKNVLNICAPKS